MSAAPTCINLIISSVPNVGTSNTVRLPLAPERFATSQHLQIDTRAWTSITLREARTGLHDVVRAARYYLANN